VRYVNEIRRSVLLTTRDDRTLSYLTVSYVGYVELFSATYCAASLRLCDS